MVELRTAGQQLVEPDLDRILGWSRSHTFEEALALYGIAPAEVVTPELIVRAGERVVLSEVMRPSVRGTADAAVFKRWIGLDDSLIEEQPMDGLPDVPQRAWPEGRVIGLDTLSDDEWGDVQLAAKAYLFGHSRLVESYKTPIEQFFGPFEADVYVIPRLVIEPGATLVVDRRPTAMLVDSLTLHEGGAIHLLTIARLRVQTLRKLAAN